MSDVRKLIPILQAPASIFRLIRRRRRRCGRRDRHWLLLLRQFQLLLKRELQLHQVIAADAGFVAIPADVLAIALGLLPIRSCYLTLVRRAAVLIA